MVLDDLGTSLRSSLDKLRGSPRLSESDVEEIVKEIQRSLLSADVDVSLVMELSDSIKTRALEEEPPGGTTAKDHVLKIVYEEMVELVGDSTELPLENQTILLAGLQGSGKTTSAAKMAWWFSKGAPARRHPDGHLPAGRVRPGQADVRARRGRLLRRPRQRRSGRDRP